MIEIIHDPQKAIQNLPRFQWTISNDLTLIIKYHSTNGKKTIWNYDSDCGWKCFSHTNTLK